MKVPAIIACSIISLVLGMGVGVVGTTCLELTADNLMFWKEVEEKASAPVMEVPPNDMAKFKGGMKGKGMGGMDMGMMDMMKGKNQSAKTQLKALITKLDVLTQKPLTVSLDAEQKKKIK